jgi:hypothetical protein
MVNLSDFVGVNIFSENLVRVIEVLLKTKLKKPTFWNGGNSNLLTVYVAQ